MIYRGSLRTSARTAASALALGSALTIGGTLATAVGPAVLLPSASAQSCSAPHQNLQGELTWGVKDSFLKYIKGPVAKGSWTTSGATDSGSSFGFTVSKGYVDSSGQGFAAGSGNVTFTGHGGLLKTSISDPTIKFTGGNSGQLLVKMSSQDPEGVPIQGLDGWVHLADINFNSSVTGGGSYTGTTTLTSTGATAFADFYEAGTQLADITLDVEGTESCDEVPTLDGLDSAGTSNGGSGTGITNKDRNLNTGHGGLDALNLLNEYLEAGNDAVNNTMAFQETLQKLANGGGNSTSKGASGNSANKSGTTGGTTANQAGNTTGGTTATGTTGGATAGTAKGASTTGGTSTVARAAASNPTGVIGTMQAASASAGGAGAAEQCTAVNSSQIAWGVKQSFRTYISGSIAKGGWEGDGVGDSGNAFTFSGGSGSVDPQSKAGSVDTSGSLRFYGHSGKLNLVISNLRATFSGNSGQLIADVQSSDVEGTPKNFGTVALGDLSYSSLDVSDSSVSGTAQVALTAAGADAFAGFYEPGTILDPIAITASLGGSSDCSSATAGASSASDGTAASASGAAAALKGGSGSSGSTAGKSAKSSNGASNGAANAKFGQNGSGDVSFHNAGDEESGDGILSAGLSSGTLSPVQLLAMLVVFGAAAASCLALSYKRKPRGLTEAE